MDSKKYTKGYKAQVNKYLKENFWNRNIESRAELSRIILGARTQYIRTVARVYLNFLEENELLSGEDADYFSKAIPSKKTSSDGFMPSDGKVKEIYRKIDSETMKTAFLIAA